MNKMQKIFNYQGNQVRTILKADEPWWVAKDVCDILELGNTAQALTRLEDDEKDTIILNEGIGNPEKSIINEAGLYSLILGSRKPEAKAFKRWITHEVLPAIRKTGEYRLDTTTHKASSIGERTAYIKFWDGLQRECGVKARERFTAIKTMSEQMELPVPEVNIEVEPVANEKLPQFEGAGKSTWQRITEVCKTVTIEPVEE